ncbi:hypothetical protein BJX65DRAFT_299786 [Aspergillus insuetus]
MQVYFRHDRSVSSTTLRSEAPTKAVYSNQVSVSVRGGSGRTLRKPAGSIIALVFEMFLCLVALCFIALALVAISIRNRPTGDSLGSAMEQAMRLGPTIYPILFAALLSRSLKSIGRYCAQRSVRMSTLWALMNTNATADPILHLTSMPASLLVWMLLVLWAMSPLGGQSTIRLMYTSNATDVSHTELRYWDNGPLGNMFFYAGIMVGNDGSWPTSMRDMYAASMMQSTNIKAGPLDQWGNVKIPRIEAGNASAASDDGWMPVPEANNIDSFTSLFGMPMVGLAELKQQGDINFTIESTYVEVSHPTTFQRNRTLDQKYGMTLDVDIWTTVTTCQVTQRMVEALIECKDGNCAATKVRESTTDHRDKNYTSFDLWAWLVLQMISEASSQEPAREVAWGTATTGLFLNDSRAFPMQSGMDYSKTDVNFTAIDPDVFSARVSILLNTGLQAFMAPTGFAGDLSTNFSLYGPPHIPGNGLLAVSNQSSYDTGLYTAWYPPQAVGILVDDLAPFVGASTDATVAHYTEVWQPDYAWASILIVSSVLLFGVGVAGICVRLKTLAPNMFDPVVGLTYGNPYMSLTGRDDDPIDADERASIIRDKTVQLGEVDDYKGVKVVFGEASYVTPLRLGVPYH